MPFEGRFVAPGGRAGERGLGPAAERLFERRAQERREGVEGVRGSEPGSGERVPRSRDEARQAVGAEGRREVVERAIPGGDGDGSAPEGQGEPLRRGAGPPPRRRSRR